MKYRINILPVLLGLVLIFSFCSDHSEPPLAIESNRGDGITLNRSDKRPFGVDTLYVNTGDTLTLKIGSVLPGAPEYEISSGNDQLFSIVNYDGNNEVIVTAPGDSGTVTSLTIIDHVNEAEKTVPVKIVKFWADPLEYTFLGSLEGHYYYQSIAKKVWTEAMELCEEANGHLVTLTSEEENEFINENRSSKLDRVWIGLTLLYDNYPLDHWITGEDLEIRKTVSSSAGIFYEVYYYMNAEGLWDNWHEELYYYILEME